MPKQPPCRLPKYRHHKPKNLAVVRINGRDVYLGRYDSPESREKYNRVIAEWLTTGEAPAPKPALDGGLTVNEVLLAFLKHADGYYRRADGSPTGELANFRHAVRPVSRLFGLTPANGIEPKALKTVRQSMVVGGLCRNLVNQRVSKIVRVFKWAVENELVPPSVHHGLKAVSGLRRGRTEARESEPVKPVPDPFVEAVRPHVSRQVWAMIELQRLTGMRPGEVTIMRTRDLNSSGDRWEYTAGRHKSEHHDRARTIPLGRKARAVLRPWLRTDLEAFLFSPREATAEFRARRRENCKTPLTPSQRARKPKRSPKRARSSRGGEAPWLRSCDHEEAKV
jgi:integrase